MDGTANHFPAKNAGFCIYNLRIISPTPAFLLFLFYETTSEVYFYYYYYFIGDVYNAVSCALSVPGESWDAPEVDVSTLNVAIGKTETHVRHTRRRHGRRNALP